MGWCTQHARTHALRARNAHAPTHVHADGAPVEFAVEYEHRSADKLDRQKLIDAFVDHIKMPPHKVGQVVGLWGVGKVGPCVGWKSGAASSLRGRRACLCLSVRGVPQREGSASA